MKKFETIFITFVGIIAAFSIMYLIKVGLITVEKSDENLIWMFLILLPVLSILIITLRVMKYSDIERVVKITEEEKKKLKEIKRKYKNRALNKFTFQLISIVVLLIVLSIWLDTVPFLLTIFIFCVALVRSVLKYANDDIWYYNIDEFLYLKYNLEECLNKKDKINELKQEISLLKEQLKQRKKTGKMEKKLFQPEEVQIRKINQELNKLKNINKYKKMLPDGSYIYFEFSIISIRYGRNNIKYNIKCTLISEQESLKHEVEIIEKYQNLHINICENGSVETEFTRMYNEMNYDILANLVCYSYEACKEFLNIEN